MQQGHSHLKGNVRHTASQLAEMGYCERKMLLRLQHGPRTSLSRFVAQKRGTLAHERFLSEARKLNPCVSSDVPVHMHGATTTRRRPLRALLARIVSQLLKFIVRNR